MCSAILDTASSDEHIIHPRTSMNSKDGTVPCSPLYRLFLSSKIDRESVVSARIVLSPQPFRDPNEPLVR